MVGSSAFAALLLFFLLLPPPPFTFFKGGLRLRMVIILLMCFWLVFSFAGIESLLSIDDVLRKWYRETNLVETLPPSCRVDRLAANSPPVTLDLKGSSATVGE